MSTAIKDQIMADIKEAMKAKDKDKLATLRLISAAIKQFEVDNREDADDAKTLAILNKLAKQRKESIAQFDQAGREDLSKKEHEELGLISTYLPQPLSSEEVETLIKRAIEETNANGPKDMGKVMAFLKTHGEGRIDLGTVSGQIKNHLS